jgi:regulatory protein
VNVFIDGKFALGLFDDVVLTLGLRIGQQITPERLEEIAQAETLRKAIEDAYNLLSYRSRSEKEIADRLQRKGYEEEVIAQVVEKLRAAGYLNDEAFARNWVEGRGKTLGRRALAHELRQKGVDSETVAQTLVEIKSDEAEQAAARTAAVRKVGERPLDRSREARAKLAAFLQRRGFGWDIIRPILTDLYEIRDDAETDGDEGATGVENSDNE